MRDFILNAIIVVFVGSTILVCLGFIITFVCFIYGAIRDWADKNE